MPGALLTITLFVISIALDIMSNAAGADQYIQLIMHCLQSAAAFTAVLVGICTVSPKFKERLKKLFNL
jgi:fatty acid/phospholipid biosynthesis enzyme